MDASECIARFVGKTADIARNFSSVSFNARPSEKLTSVGLKAAFVGAEQEPPKGGEMFFSATSTKEM